MKNRRPASVFFTAVLLIVLYFALFPYPLGKELVAKPSWAVDIATTSSNSAAGDLPGSGDEGISPFQLGDLFGYVGPEGKLVHVGQRLFQTALSQTGYINYTRVGTDWIMRDPHGARLLAFSGFGYPLLSPDGRRVLVVSPDSTGLREVDGNGDTAWSRDFPATMTSVSLQGDFLLVGLLNGSLQLLGRNGRPIFQAPPSPSRIPVIYGCAVTNDGAFIASVSGLEPQVLTVLGRNGLSYTGALREILSTDYRREVRVGFSPDSRCLYYEDGRGVGLVEPSSGRTSSLSFSGKLAGCAFLKIGGLAAFAGRDGGRVDLRVVSPFVATFSSETFTAGDFFLGTIGGQLLLGLDGRLLRVDIKAL
ncbi:MAG TPA: hypothetical protein VMU36_09250 [Spirochaetia bacterium]|nr:hypothetical protein [Spirochaetia bacterium]